MTLIVLVLVGFFLASLVVPFFIDGGVPHSIFTGGTRETSWGRANAQHVQR